MMSSNKKLTVKETKEWLKRGNVILPRMRRESKKRMLLQIAELREKEKQEKRFIQFELPEEGFSRELLRVKHSTTHGEIVVTLSSRGKVELIAYANPFYHAIAGRVPKALPSRTYVILEEREREPGSVRARTPWTCNFCGGRLMLQEWNRFDDLPDTIKRTLLSNGARGNEAVKLQKCERCERLYLFFEREITLDATRVQGHVASAMDCVHIRSAIDTYRVLTDNQRLLVREHVERCEDCQRWMRKRRMFFENNELKAIASKR